MTAQPARKLRVIQGGKRKPKMRKWEMVYQGLVEARFELRRGHASEARNHLRFTIMWANKWTGRSREETAFAPVVTEALEDIIHMIPRNPEEVDNPHEPVYAAITTLQRFIQREAKVRAVDSMLAKARDLHIKSDRVRQTMITRAIKEALERALGRR